MKKIIIILFMSILPALAFSQSSFKGYSEYRPFNGISKNLKTAHKSSSFKFKKKKKRLVPRFYKNEVSLTFLRRNKDPQNSNIKINYPSQMVFFLLCWK